MKWKSHGISLCLLASTILISCSKHKDEQAPVVIIHGPGNLSSYQLPASIPVDVEIRDDQSIEEFSISIYNSQGETAFREIWQPGQKEIRETFSCAVNGLYLSSGTYTLKVSASDGVNSSSAYGQLQLIEIPKALEAIHVLCYGQSNPEIFRLDNGTFISEKSIPHTVKSAYISNASHQIALHPVSGFPVQALHTSTFGDAFQLLYQNIGTTEYFQSMNYSGEGTALWVAFGNQQMRAYNGEGNIENTISQPANRVTKKMIAGGRTLLCDEENTSNGNHYLSAYNLNTGLSFFSTSISGEIMDGRLCTNGKFILFINENTTSGVYEFDPDQSILSLKHNLASGRVLEMTAIDFDLSCLAHENGILLYSYQNNISGFFNNSIQIQHIAFDPVNEEIHTGNNKSYSVIDYTNGAIVQQYTCSDTIRKILLEFNK